MFFTKNRENEIIDFLAKITVIIKNATGHEFDGILSRMPSRELKIVSRFLDKQKIFVSEINELKKNSRPCGECAHKGSNGGNEGYNP
jgi:hypothetical protein